MKVLVAGNGAREHAILWKLRQSPLVTELYAVPGNAGMEDIAICIDPGEAGNLKPEDYADIAVKYEVDLTVIGPETLLTEGVVDHFIARNLPVFGPTAAAARLEGSKIWAKELMQRVGIPTASWRAFTEVEDAVAHARELVWNCVVKYDGLAAGKGSFVCESEANVRDAITALLVDKRYGCAPVIVEERLSGQEVSVFAISDGVTVIPFGAAQDHKRAFDNDAGPNTGGMGAYSPVDHMQVAQDFAVSFFQPIVTTLAAEGTPFVGVLYAGAIITAQGPKILEFNCRFGDPEAEVLLCRLQSDLAEILSASVDQRLHTLTDVEWTTQEALCVVMTSRDYPPRLDFGTPIFGTDAADAVPGVTVFHAGTHRDIESGQLVTHGGRILAVTGTGRDLHEAQARAYQAVEQIRFDGARYRTDIGCNATGTSMWTAEWRKPPRWEVSVSIASHAIGDVARHLETIEVGNPAATTELKQLRDRLFDIKMNLQSAPSDIGTVGRSRRRYPASANLTSERLAELTRRFDEFFDDMQDDGVRDAVDKAMRSSSAELASIVKSDIAQGRRSSRRKRV